MYQLGMINDAVSIVLFESVKTIFDEADHTGDANIFTWGAIGTIFLDFIAITSISIVIGVIMGN